MIAQITITALDIGIVVGVALVVWALGYAMARHERQMLAEFDDLERERLGE